MVLFASIRTFGRHLNKKAIPQPLFLAGTAARARNASPVPVSLSPYSPIARFFCDAPVGKSDSEGLHGNPGAAEAGSKYNEQKDVPDQKTRVLQAALLHVSKLGWSEAALVAGARDVGLSPAVIGLFPGKESALVEFFMDDCLQKLSDIIEREDDELLKFTLQERIIKLLKFRLEMQIPSISQWAQALSIQAHPANVPTSLKQRAILMDEIWHAVGDHSSDIDWYAKRGILAAVYTATELYMLTDYSDGFKETWSFLERRVKDAFDCSKTAKEVSQVAQAIVAGLGNSFQSLFRR